MVHEMIDGTYRQTNLPNESPGFERFCIDKKKETREQICTRFS